MRLLLGGVPFGCDNVGDEAILECAVAIFREVCPAAKLTVSTRDREATARRLRVETCGLLGFYDDVSPDETRRTIERHDVFVWCGATGLSDYPESALELLARAHEAGKRTVLWGVGMSSEFNPALYRVDAGKRRRLLDAMTGLTLGTVDFTHVQERIWERRARRKIARELRRATLVVVRDPESRDEILRCGVEREVLVGADSALVLEPRPLEAVQLEPEVRKILLSHAPRIGVCISAQRALRQREELHAYLRGILSETDARIVFIPMNPITDAGLMKHMTEELACPDRAVVASGRYEPREVLAIASSMDLVISSRLHLLIFASISHVPIIGIARGSKLDNFLKPFGLKTVGDVEQCDLDLLRRETLRLLDQKSAFQKKSIEVRAQLLARLDHAREALQSVLLE